MINYIPAGKYLLLKPDTQTDSGIQLLANYSQTGAAIQVAAVGPEVTSYIPGDMVVFDSSVLLWNIDGVEYYQIHEANILGKVINGGKIKQGTPPEAPGEPTDHYLQK